MTVTIYSTSTCPYCRMVKEYLNQKGVPFVEKMIDTDENAQQEMLTVSNGFMGVPFTVITKDDGTNDTVVGFDKGKLEQILA